MFLAYAWQFSAFGESGTFMEGNAFRIQRGYIGDQSLDAKVFCCRFQLCQKQLAQALSHMRRIDELADIRSPGKGIELHEVFE